jgi:hypothetical protein
VQKVREDLDVKVVMYWDTQDIQIKTEGECLPGGNPNTCSDAASGWSRCASGAMPCCSSYECNGVTSAACPEDDYARALWAVYKPAWAVNELHAPTDGRPGRSGTPICTYGKGPLGCHSAQVRKTPSWANFSLLWLYSY